MKLLNRGKSVKELTTEFRVRQASIHRWEKEFRSPILDHSESIKVKTSEKELKNIKLECDILKKTESILFKRDN